MTERTENEMYTILSNLSLGVSLAPLKKMLKKASVAEKISEETKNLAVHFTRQTPVHCLLQLVGGDDGEMLLQPLLETKSDMLRFAPDSFVKEHEKTGAEKLYQKFEVDGQCSAVLAELEKPHASNVYIVDEKKECVYPLASERGKAMCGTVIVVLARSRGTQAEQIKRILKSRRVLTEMIRHFDPAAADAGDASSMEAEDEKKTKKVKKPEEKTKKTKKTKRSKSHKESDSDEEEEEDSPSAVQSDASSGASGGVEDEEDSSEEEASSESSSSSSSEESESSGSEKKKKKSKGGKKAEKHKKEKKPKKSKQSVKGDKKPKKAINPTVTKTKKPAPVTPAPTLPEKKKPLPTPPPPAKKTAQPCSTSTTTTTTTTTGASGTTGPRTRPQKAGAPTTLPVTAEERKVAVSEALQTQQRTEELFQWFQSLPEADAVTNTAEISATD